MKFIETTREHIISNAVNKKSHKDLKDKLMQFLETGYQYAEVIDDEGRYNNNNDLRRAIQYCIKMNDLPIVVFMYKGVTYIEKL